MTPLTTHFQCPECGPVSCEPVSATVVKFYAVHPQPCGWRLRLTCPQCGERCAHEFPLSRVEATGWLDQGADLLRIEWDDELADQFRSTPFRPWTEDDVNDLVIDLADDVYVKGCVDGLARQYEGRL